VNASAALYVGEVIHQRLATRRHRLRYHVFSLLLDVDEIDALSRALRLFSRNRFNAFSFYDEDFGDGSRQPIAERVRAVFEQGGIETKDCRIHLLCYPRVFGYVFNPLSVYFCYRGDGSLSAILYEVTNTFHQRHSYLIPVAATANGVITQACAKRLYVSPFFPVDGEYRFRIVPPGERVLIAINYRGGDHLRLHAAFRGERRPLSDATLVRYGLRLPLLTWKVIGGIHWEAFKLWVKGVPLIGRPAPPAEPVSVVRSSRP
jgi:DUF1365 family protein